MTAILATILVLGVLIFVHELGHFMAAKAVGVEVQRFSIGLGPKLFGFRRGETDYVVSAIPLGGYVKMGGMGDDVMEQIEGGPTDSSTPPERAFDRKPIWARTLVISAGVAMNFLFAFLAYTAVAVGWGVRVESADAAALVGTVNPGGSADVAGIRAGDVITAVGDVRVTTWDELVAEVEARPGESVDLSLEREGRTVVRIATLDARKVELEDGTSVTVGRLGIGQLLDYASVSAGEAVAYGYRQTVAISAAILQFLADLITGNTSPRDVGSIFTIGEASGQAARMGLGSLLSFMALFSVNLAIVNLLPIPVLDGGHLLFLAIEAIRGGKPLTARQRLRWSNVGFFVVLGIMVWALSNDVVRMLGS